MVDLGKPLAIIIDENSASASEIVAACLQDHERAVIVGTRSYGKGTVQNILPLQFGRSALRLTVARYFRPSDKNIHRNKDATEEDDWGVIPNTGFEVKLDEDTLKRLAKRWQEASYPMLADQKPTGNRGDSLLFDPQLKRAVDHLLKKAGIEPIEDEADESPEESEELLQPAA